MAAKKSGEISGEKVKPSTLIPAEGRQRGWSKGGGPDARRFQTAVEFFNVNAASEIKLRDGEAGRKSGTEGDYDLALKGFSSCASHNRICAFFALQRLQ